MSARGHEAFQTTFGLSRPSLAFVLSAYVDFLPSQRVSVIVRWVVIGLPLIF